MAAAGLLPGDHRGRAERQESDFTDDVRAFTSYSFKPQLKTVGPKYGKLLGGIRKRSAELDGNAAMDELKADGQLTFDLDGEKVVLIRRGSSD